MKISPNKINIDNKTVSKIMSQLAQKSVAARRKKGNFREQMRKIARLPRKRKK